MLGHEVEEVEDRAKGLEPFIVAYVVSAEQHPDADKLRVCVVDTGPKRSRSSAARRMRAPA